MAANDKARDAIEQLIIDHDGAVPAHVVRQILEGFSAFDDEQTTKRAVELLGFRIIDGFVMECNQVIVIEASHASH